MFLSGVKAYAVNVSSFSYFNQLWRSGITQNVELSSNIVFTADPTNRPVSNLNMNITGNGFAFDGSNSFIGLRLNNSSVTVNGGVIFQNFLNSSPYTSEAGGALQTNNSTMSFVSVNRSIKFISNSTRWYGGAIYNYGSVMSFNVTNGNIEFSSNNATFGGAIEANYTIIDFNVVIGNIIFNSNKTIYNSGAIRVFASTISLNITNGNIEFTGNSGGAINASGTIMNVNVSNGSIIFSSNSATSGAGAYVVGYSSSDGSSGFSSITFSGGSVIFEGNEAGGSGGALYINNSTVTFNTNDGKAVFRGNKANGRPNDVYMDFNAKLNISGSNTIRFEGGILSPTSGTGIEINKSGSGAIYLGGDNEIWGDFNITGGDIIFLADATYKGKALKLGNSALDMNNGTINTVEVDGNFESRNNLKIDVFTDSSDKITAGSASIDGNIDIFAEIGIYNKKEFDLITTGGAGNLTGEFTSNWINDGALSYELKYNNGIVKLILDGMSVTRFGELSLLTYMTYNQKETVKTFDILSKEYDKNTEWRTILTSMKDKQNSGTDADIAEVKAFLSQTSGYFLANVIRNMAADSPNNEVYDKIKNYKEGYETNSGLWVQLKGGMESFKKDENSFEDYKNTSIGVMFGFDRFLLENAANGDAIFGVYGRINKDNIEQGKHKASGNKNGLGVYGGYAKDKFELKAMLLGSYDKFGTERAVMGQTAKADISAVTISADAEAALGIELNEVMKFKPYFGMELANTIYGGFQERGTGNYNLDVNGGNYLRSAARIGAGLDYEKEIWLWYANVEGKYKITGTKTEIEAAFENTGIMFNSRGSEEGNMEAGIGVGAEVRVAYNWKIFTNGKYYIGERYENLYGNIGVRYIFGETAVKPKKVKSQKMLNKNKDNPVNEESLVKKSIDKEKSAKKEFNKARKLYNKGEYLRATDMLSEIIAAYPDFKLSAQLYTKIKNEMEKTSESREEPDFSKLTYAKGYCAYYEAEYNTALMEWDRYIQFVGKNKEIVEYINKVKNALEFKNFINREAELDAKANKMLNAGIEKYNAAKWMLCIKDMEALQKFVTENKFSGTDEYYNKAKEYIDMSVKELAKAIKAGKKEVTKKPETQVVENKPEIDEATADQKYNEGLVLYAQGKYLEAERAWELTLRLNPNHQKAKIALSKLRSSGQLGE